MIVTLTGAYRNVGDHLIGHRARLLLEKNLNDHAVNLDRKQIQPKHYELFNEAKAIFLCGGPAYQKNIYPDIYPIDLHQINKPVIPFGLGWKGSLGQDIKDFVFSEESMSFINDIHASVKYSSVRDDLTAEVLQNSGVENTIMTGCPAWYDLDFLNTDYQHILEKDIKSVAYSAPAVCDDSALKIIAAIAQRFPKAKKILTLHHGYFVSKDFKTIKKTLGFLKMANFSKKYGYEVIDLSGKVENMNFYNDIDLHIGYRVHAHIYMLSRRQASYLIAEDSRAIGQQNTLKMNFLDTQSKSITEDLTNILDQHFNEKGEQVISATNVMKNKYNVMKNFLCDLKV